MKKPFLFLTLFFFINQSLLAEEGLSGRTNAFLNSADKERILRVTLGDCIKMTLKNNSEIKIKRIEPQIAKSLVRLKDGVYEPTFDFELKYKDSEIPSRWPLLTGVTTDTEQRVDWDFGFGGILPFGTKYDIDFLNSELKTNSALQSFYPEYSVIGSIGITQPILKGFFIDANRADIRIARNNKNISKEDFIKEVIDIVTNVEDAYYDYIGLYEIGKLSLKRAEELRNITQERYRKGEASSVDLLESETGLIQREEALLQLEGQLKGSEDYLKLITNLVDDPELWNAEIAATELPQFKVEPVDLVSSVKEAFEHRPDYKMAQFDLKNKDVKVKLSWDNLMPQVDLVGSFALNGLTSEYEKSTSQAFDDADYDDWSVGVKVSVPFGFQKERADLRINKLEKQKALIGFYRLEQSIILELRDVTRWVDINSRKVKTAKKRRETEQKRYNAAKERFRAGLLSTHDKLEYQEDYESAEVNYLKAIIDYNKSLNKLKKVTGTTLVRNNIKVEE